MGVRVLQRVQSILDCDLPPNVLGSATPLDVRPNERGKSAAGSQRRAFPAPQGELGVALGLFLERHRQHGAVLTGLDMRGRYDRCRSTHRTRSMHPKHRLADRAEGV